ncbi:DUF4157 domain-containing protein [Nostoc linckia FACHB-104]|nr:DUF4157 domain-containing protein [Nostoc linckia FACHB-104]
MSTQQLLQKKSKSTSTNTATIDNQFEGRGFAVQSKSETQQADLNTQLKQAKRFGHSITQMKSEQTAQPSKQNQANNNSSSASRSSMPAPVRSKMENSFGTSFGDVNIHPESHKATSMGALAFTQGNNIHFAPGQYNPQSSSGQALLGHELTHVVQQRAGRVAVPHQSKGAPINADPSLESEADQIGAKAAKGEPVQVPGATSNFKTIPPIQNSTHLVQCKGGLLGGLGNLVGGLLGGGQDQEQGGGGGLSGIGGMIGGMFGPLGGIAGSMLGGVADSVLGGGQ